MRPKSKRRQAEDSYAVANTALKAQTRRAGLVWEAVRQHPERPFEDLVEVVDRFLAWESEQSAKFIEECNRLWDLAYKGSAP